MVVVDDSRFKWLTKKQREIAMLAKKQGFVKLRDIVVMYSTKEHWSRAIQKLMDFGILKPDRNKPKAMGSGMTVFKYIPNEIEQEQKKVIDFDKLQKEEQKAIEAEASR